MKNILPFERAYWVVPGQLMAGEYPAAPDAEETQRKLQGLVDVGIKVVINLTEADEANKDGVKLYDYRDDLEEMGVKVYRMAIPDLSTPPKGKMDAIIQLIDEALAEKKPVYFHCWGGVGRTGTVLGCYLLQTHLIDQGRVFDMIHYLKRTTSISRRPSPENQQQKDFVLDYLKKEEVSYGDTTSKKGRDFFAACMIGGAVGDALGAPIEFMKKAEIFDRYGDLGVDSYVEFNDGIGRFTDDTQMALFTAEGLLRAYNRGMQRGIYGALRSIAYNAYQRWLITQGERPAKEVETSFLMEHKILHVRRAPGMTCLQALKSGQQGDTNRRINDSKGCGTIMRVAPVGLINRGNREMAFREAVDVSALSHGHPSGYLSAGAFASIIADLAVYLPLDIAIDNAVELLKTYVQHEETLKAINRAIELYKQVKGADLQEAMRYVNTLGEAWVAEEALSISLYVSLLFENDFKSGVMCAINHSGDSDSTGSIVGNILGLINGLQAIPQTWRDKLEGYDLVDEIAQDLYTRFKGDSINRDNEWSKRYPGC